MFYSFGKKQNVVNHIFCVVGPYTTANSGQVRENYWSVLYWITKMDFLPYEYTYNYKLWGKKNTCQVALDREKID